MIDQAAAMSGFLLGTVSGSGSVPPRASSRRKCDLPVPLAPSTATRSPNHTSRSNGNVSPSSSSCSQITARLPVRPPRSRIRTFWSRGDSSGGELKYCVDDPKPRRLPFDLERVMRTEYRIDRYQDTYFVIDSFEHLMRETVPDFTPIYARLRSLPSFAADAA